MARRKKTLQLEGRKNSVEVFELTFNEIKSIFDMEGVEDTGFEALASHFGGAILPLVTNLSKEELIELAPSEAKEIWEAVRDVNSVFFLIANQAGISEFLVRFKDALLTDCSTYVASLLSKAMSGPSPTATAT